MANPLIKPVKKALNKIYKSVSVRNGSGTAWGWVNIDIDISKPDNCFCKENESYCSVCRELINKTSENAYKIANKALKDKNLKPYTFTSDNSHNTEQDEMICQVSIV